MELAPEKRLDSSPRVAGGDNFSVEDLLDFSNVEKNLENVADDSKHSSPVVESCNSCSTMSDSVSTIEFGNGGVPDTQFSGDLCVPSDDLAELEWLSNFVEEKSFSNEDKEKLQLLSGLAASCLSDPTKTRAGSDFTTTGSFHPDDVVHHASTTTTTNQHPIFDEEVAVPAKARTKRSRAATGNWTSKLLQRSSADQAMTLVPPEGNKPISPNSIKKPGPASPRPKKKKCGSGTNELVRKCLHCDTTATPQWRSGPLGPQTLCNACGVRYKSGRLVPEYRPASSPTFVLTEHSNSHRKVMELRRRKEMAMMQQSHSNRYHQRPPVSDFIHNGVILDLPNPNDYLIQQHVQPDFRRLM